MHLDSHVTSYLTYLGPKPFEPMISKDETALIVTLIPDGTVFTPEE